MAEEQGPSAKNEALIKRFIGDDNWRRGDFLWSGIINDLLNAARSEGRSEGPAKPPQGDVGADSGLAAADDNRPDVPRDEEGRDAYQIIADCNRHAMLRRAGVKDRSREPLLGPPRDMLVSRILLEALPDIDPRRADQLAVKINDAIPADDNHTQAEVSWRVFLASDKDWLSDHGRKMGSGVGQQAIERLLIALDHVAADDNHKALVEALERIGNAKANYIVSGSLGPLYTAGWNAAAAHLAWIATEGLAAQSRQEESR